LRASCRLSLISRPPLTLLQAHKGE
jgi:hypothetical protein